jgi:ABC-type multidrug transport system ATPase subunit/pSer/pThr/pTyr-binding forkhead associated (FHA) protein
MIVAIEELGIRREFAEGETVSIGRKDHGADIEIDNELVSRQHAGIKLENGQVKIFDKSSMNGVKVNDNRLAAGEWIPLSGTDKITIAGYTLRFYGSAPAPTPVPKPTPVPAPAPNPPVTPPPPVVKNTGLNERFQELIRFKLPVKIGRLPDNDIALPDLVPDDRIVGRHHAEIFFNDGRYWVKDLDSKNGTYVNDERLQPMQPRAIDNSDIVLIHLHLFSVTEGYKDLREEVAIRAEGIGKTYPNGFVGLNSMSVEIPFKQIVALMGPSGCGKSTLLKALNGDDPATSGNVFIHGLSLRENYQLLKRKIGYVPQDDTIHKELTVERTLYLAAKLRLPDDTKDEYINTRINEVLESLNFHDSVREKVVGGLSGGQRKRICIAVELLSQPTILFLDEPTSPLDPETIEEFLNSLRNLANNGTTIIMVTHKPEDMNYADKIIFMAAKGYFVHYGDKTALLNKFHVDNIIKVYNICGRQDFNSEAYYIKPEGRIVHKNVNKEISVDKQNNLLLQYYWLSKRYLQIKLSDRYNLYLLLAQPFIIALLVVVIFHQLSERVMMLIAISAIWFGVSNSSKEIVGEYPIYKRERMFILKINTYILSKWTVLSLISLVQVVIYLSIIYLKFHNEGLGSYLANVSFMFFIASSATLFGLFLSSYFNTTEKVLTVVPIALMPQIMLAGVVEHIGSLKVDLLSYLMLGRWGTEGLLRLQDDAQLNNATLNALYYSPKLEDRGYHTVHLFDSVFGNVVAILLISAIMYVLTYYSLKKKDTI